MTPVLAVLPALAADRLTAAIPDWARHSEWYDAARAILGAELDAYLVAIVELEQQFFIPTATWSLTDWEVRLGLPVQENWTQDDRRERLLAHLRSRGETTIGRVKFVAEAFLGGEIDVIDDFGAYKVLIKFVNVGGIPANIVSFQAAMREIIPAHLDIDYLYSFYVWNALDFHAYNWNTVDGFAYTWDQWDSLT